MQLHPISLLFRVLLVSTMFALAPLTTYGQAQFQDSSFLNGDTGNVVVAYKVATDSTGNYYVLATTNGAIDASLNPLNAPIGDQDAAVIKLDENLVPISSVYLGGTGFDTPYGIVLDSSDNVYIVGQTPTLAASMNPVNGPLGGTDGFIIKLNSSLTIGSSRYLGSTDSNSVNALTIDSGDTIYLAGQTYNTLDGSMNATNSFLGGIADVFITSLDTNITPLASTHLGGTGLDWSALDITLDSNEDPFVLFQSNSTLAPAMNAENSPLGSLDLVLTHLNSSLGVVSSIHLGTSADDSPVGVSIASNNEVYALGFSSGTIDGSLNPSGSPFGDVDALLFEVSSDFSTTLSRYIGGSGADYPVEVLVSDDDIYVAGSAFADLDSTMQPSNSPAGIDGFVTVLDRTLTIEHSTYVGGSSYEQIQGAFRTGNTLTVVGGSTSSTFPAAMNPTNTHTNPGWQSGFISVLSFATILTQTESVSMTALVTEALIMTLDAAGVNLQADPAVSDGQYLAGKSIITIASNALSGYTIQAALNDGDNNAQLKNSAGDVIPANIGAGDNYLGYTARNDGTGSASNAEQDFTLNSSTLLDENGDPVGYNATTDSQAHTINYDLNVNFLTPAGVYTGTIYYTVLANF